MALNINKQLTTKSGFTVSPGSYVWLLITLGFEKTYTVEVKCIFFKDKASFDAGVSRYAPSDQDIPANKQYYTVSMTPSTFADVTALSVHQYVRDQLNAVLGAGIVTIVA